LTKLNKTGHTTDVVEVFVNDEALFNHNKLTCVFIVMKLYAFDMKELLSQATNIEEHQAVVIAYNLILSLKVLHASDLIHRDLKP
jgi:serine/threonine protein kinase